MHALTATSVVEDVLMSLSGSNGEVMTLLSRSRRTASYLPPLRSCLEHEPIATLVVSMLRVVTHEVVGAALQADLRAISRVRSDVDGKCRVVREGVAAQVWPESSDHVIGEKVVIAAAIFWL